VRRIAVVGLTALVAATAVNGLGRAYPATDAGEVRALLLRQSELSKQGRWREMYKTYTPRYRERCPFTKFVADQRAVRKELGTRFALRGIRVRVRGAQATAAYKAVAPSGRTLGAVTFADGDRYTRIGGRWYDEYDRVSAC
jgi:hypothetical protein